METPKRTGKVHSSNTAIASDTSSNKKLLAGDLSVINTETSRMVDLISGFDGNPEQEALLHYTQALSKGLVAVHKLMHCPPELRKFLVRGICRFLSQATNEKEWVKGAKYLLTFPIARYLSNPEPANPFKRNFLTHRRYYRWLSARLEQRSEKNTWFFTSWLQAKRGCEPLSEKMILQSLEDHRAGMLTEDCATAELVEDVFREGSNFCKLMQLVRNKLHKRIKDRVPKNPSPNASFLASRAVGGQRGELVARAMGFLRNTRTHKSEAPDRSMKYLEDFPQKPSSDHVTPVQGIDPDYVEPPRKLVVQPKREKDLKYLNFSRRFDMALMCQDESELVSMSYLPAALLAGRVKDNVVVETRTMAVYWDIEKMLFCETARDDSEFDHVGLADDEGNLSYRPYALVAPILEPLKIRMVSAGPARLYASLKSYQKDIHSVLRGIPLFRLVGRPQSPTDLSDLVSTTGNSDIRYFQEPLWLSADYAAATDHLSSSLSSRIHKELLEGSGSLLEDAQRALGSHRIVYPPVITYNWELRNWAKEPGEVDMRWVSTKETHNIPSVTQRNGQLMGSIVSFPILCLANAAALDLYQRRERLCYSFQEYLRSALINGDDLVTIVDGKDQLYRFKEISASLGLDLTIGKSYIDSSYANINSAAYHYNLTALQSYLRERDLLKESLGLPGDTSHLFYEHQNGARNQHLPIPRAVDYFNYGLYSEKHKVMERVGGQSENLDVLDNDPEFSTELFDPNHYSYSNLPQGAHRLLQRLKDRFARGKEGGEQLSIPEEGDRPFWAVANRIAQGTPSEYRAKIEAELHKRIYLKGEDIFIYKKEGDKSGKWRWGRRNHRLPISCGGLGLFPDSKERYYVTNLQRAVAKAMREERVAQGYELNTQLPRKSPPPHSISIRHLYGPRPQRVVEIPVLDIQSGSTWRFKTHPLIPSGGYTEVI